MRRHCKEGTNGENAAAFSPFFPVLFMQTFNYAAIQCISIEEFQNKKLMLPL